MRRHHSPAVRRQLGTLTLVGQPAVERSMADARVVGSGLVATSSADGDEELLADLRTSSQRHWRELVGARGFAPSAPDSCVLEFDLLPRSRWPRHLAPPTRLSRRKASSPTLQATAMPRSPAVVTSALPRRRSGRERSNRHDVHPVWPCEAESRAGDHAERNRRWAGHAIPQPQEVGGGTVHHGR